MSIWSRLFRASSPPPPLAAPLVVVPDEPAMDDFVIAPTVRNTRTYPADRITPARWGWITKNADDGETQELMELYDAVAEDAHVASTLRTRKLAVAGAPWKAEPPDEDDDLAVEIAERCEKSFRRMEGFTQLKVDLLDAVYRGFSAVWPKWEDHGQDGLEIARHEPIESRLFRFEDGVRPLLITERASQGEPLPPGLIFATWRDKAGQLSRGGIGRSITKLWLYKGYAVLDTASFLERFGHPYVHAELPPGMKEGSAELERVKSAIKGLMVDQVALVSPGVQLKMLEAIGKVATVKDTFLVWIAWCEAGISKAGVGQVASSSFGPSGLGHGGEAREQGEVRQDLREYDGCWLDELITAQLFRPWVRYNYGPDAPVPRHCSEVGKPVDKKAEAEARETEAKTYAIIGRQLGLSLSKKQLREKFDALEPDDSDPDDALVAPKGEPAVPPGGGEDVGPEEERRAPAAFASLEHRTGACPHCGGGFTLAAAEKKKRSLRGA